MARGKGIGRVLPGCGAAPLLLHLAYVCVFVTGGELVCVCAPTEPNSALLLTRESSNELTMGR